MLQVESIRLLYSVHQLSTLVSSPLPSGLWIFSFGLSSSERNQEERRKGQIEVCGVMSL